ncbi:hypothetical protein E2542_SST05796 [Spatholobus suberectus]|nr:hypothetical protein E2542_SST05796 [Spatholobus suberectus]
MVKQRENDADPILRKEARIFILPTQLLQQWSVLAATASGDVGKRKRRRENHVTGSNLIMASRPPQTHDHGKTGEAKKTRKIEAPLVLFAEQPHGALQTLHIECDSVIGV